MKERESDEKASKGSRGRKNTFSYCDQNFLTDIQHCRYSLISLTSVIKRRSFPWLSFTPAPSPPYSLSLFALLNSNLSLFDWLIDCFFASDVPAEETCDCILKLIDPELVSFWAYRKLACLWVMMIRGLCAHPCFARADPLPVRSAFGLYKWVFAVLLGWDWERDELFSSFWRDTSDSISLFFLLLSSFFLREDSSEYGKNISNSIDWFGCLASCAFCSIARSSFVE